MEYWYRKSQVYTSITTLAQWPTLTCTDVTQSHKLALRTQSHTHRRLHTAVTPHTYFTDTVK